MIGVSLDICWGCSLISWTNKFSAGLLKVVPLLWKQTLTLGLEAVLLECVHASYFRASSECQECSISFSFPCSQVGSESISMTTLRIASSTLESAILFAEHKDFVSA